MHIRRARTEGHDYFFANLTGKAFDGWLQLGVSAESAMILDPLTGQAGTAAVKRGAQGRLQVYLQLESGQSMLVSTVARKGQAINAAVALRETQRRRHPASGRMECRVHQGRAGVTWPRAHARAFELDLAR